MKKRLITVFMAVIMTVVFMPIVGTQMAYATDKTADQAIEWAKSQVGHSVGYDDGSGYYQCVEFIQAYYKYLGVSQVSGSGYQYATNALPAGWTRTAGGVPQKGDILVYSQYSASVQQYGHVAIYESDNSLYDQDGSVYGATVKNERKNYRTYTYNYWGCIHPNFSTQTSVSFSNWESDGKTYIASTDASIGQKVNVSGGSWTEVGMILYNNSRGELGRASDRPTIGVPQYYYKINEELHVTLSPGTTYQYRFYAVVNGQTYYSEYKSFTTQGLSVSFSNWESSGRTYIGETDASIGQRVDVTGGSWSQVGMILYDNSRKELGRASDTPTTGIPQYYYKINEELHVALTPGTTYQYRFYAVVNGQTYYSDYKSFKTNGIAPPVVLDKPQISWIESYSFPSKTSALVCLKANASIKASFSSASIKVWDANNKLVATKTENSSVNTTTSLPIWYDIYSETGVILQPNSKYTYQISVTANGYVFNSEKFSFRTENNNEKHYGIDVSSHQGDINWQEVSKYVDFAIIRCGYGSDYTENDDPCWEKNVRACEENNIPYGVYLYSYAENDQEAASEAEHALRLLSGHHPSLPVYLDLEDGKTVANLSNDRILAQAMIFCSRMHNAGYKAGVYASKSWWESRLQSPVYDTYEKWVAVYSGSYAAQAKGVDMWQYSSSGKVPGINGKVDANYRIDNTLDSKSQASTSKSKEVEELPAVTIVKAKASKKSAIVKWKKISKKNQNKIGKIQIQYSKDKSFKTGVKTVYAKKTATSKKIKKLKSKKQYYFRVRAYKNVNGVVYVSKWSKYKKAKIR